MIQELCELGKKLREDGEVVDYDVLDNVAVGVDLVIDEEGNFIDFIELPNEIDVLAEMLSSKKGKARLLVDKPEETFAYKNDIKKHALYIDKLKMYKDIKSLTPVFKFYENLSNEKKNIVETFENNISEKTRNKNIAFRIGNELCRVNEKKEVLDSVIHHYNEEYDKLKSGKRCSVCGFDDFPVVDEPHGMVKRVPEGQTSGCALVSYNEKAYESFGLSGNDNSSICMHCARLYTQSLNWLLTNGHEEIDDKNKKKFIPTNRKNFGKDTAVLYWLKSNKTLPEIELLTQPDEKDIFKLFDEVKPETSITDISSAGKMFTSPGSGKKHIVKNTDVDQFYSLSLSGAAARIAVRDWLSTSLSNVKTNLAEYFSDIEITEYSNKQLNSIFLPIERLSWACAVRKKSEQNGAIVYKIDFDDIAVARAGNFLWKSAIKHENIPLNLLDRALRRMRAEGGRIDAARAAFIKIALNRNNRGGYKSMSKELDKENKSTAYLSGRVFAVMESIQRAALGDNVNAGIRERFFSSASTTPATAFGRLSRMCQQHISKLKAEKKGLTIFFDKQLGGLMSDIDVFPSMFSLEEQGQFALGYYHQKQDIFMQSQKNKELKEAIESTEEDQD